MVGNSSRDPYRTGEMICEVAEMSGVKLSTSHKVVQLRHLTLACDGLSGGSGGSHRQVRDRSTTRGEDADGCRSGLTEVSQERVLLVFLVDPLHEAFTNLVSRCSRSR